MNAKQNKSYALITGTTSGIGYELAHCFAKNGYNIIMIGRNQDSLKELQDQLMKTYGIDVVVLVFDLTNVDAANQIFVTLHQHQYPLEILVNNAGFGLWGQFVNTDIEIEKNMVSLHITQVIQLTKLFLNYAFIIKPCKILTVSSVYAYSPVARQNIYSSTKAFQLSFSQSLRTELRAEKAHVSCLCPGITLTKFRTRMGIQDKTSWLSMTSEQVAKIAYQGLMKNKGVIVPGFWNKLYIFSCRFLPVAMISWLIYTLRGLQVEFTQHK